jgi:hypothetical protein
MNAKSALFSRSVTHRRDGPMTMYCDGGLHALRINNY